MKHNHTILALFVTVLALPMAAIGESADESIEMASNSKPIDNITVSGQKSEAALRQDLWRSEKDFYSLYNKLNDDSQYDVRCKKEAPTGSRIKSQVCRPVFLSNAITDGDVNYATSLDANPVIASDMAAFRAKLDSLIAADAELQVAAVTFGTARAQYMAATEKAAKN